MHTDGVVVYSVGIFFVHDGTWRSLEQKPQSFHPAMATILHAPDSVTQGSQCDGLHSRSPRTSFVFLLGYGQGSSGVTLMSTREHDGVMSLPDAWFVHGAFPKWSRSIR